MILAFTGVYGFFGPIVFADVGQPDEMYFSIALTSSLGTRGVIFGLLSETPNPQNRKFGRLTSTESFRISRVGANPIPTGIGWSLAGDGYPFRSPRFSNPLVYLYLTDKDEPILVDRNEDGSEYRAYVPMPWSEGTSARLINFSDLALPHPVLPMTAEITGTMANRDILVTLRGDHEEYSFKFNFDSGPMRNWVRTAVPANGVGGIAKGPTSQAKPKSNTIGDQIRVNLIDQQAVGRDAHLLTVMAEDPVPDASGPHKAFYYFVQNSPDGTETQFLTGRVVDDRRAVKDDFANKHFNEPKGKLLGSIRTWDARFELSIGQDTSHFLYDYTARKWKEEKRDK